ncbi:MAG: HEAT repeat domain-containing protein [Proteobacteria bacterium]|nr:HEAT repeat domain-containing protein [Pseudomonadota bacterium]
MDETSESTHRTGALFVWVVALPLHATSLLAAWRFHTGKEPLFAVLALCLLVASSLAFVLPCLFSSKWRENSSSIYGLTATLTLCVPGAGIIGCLLALLCAQLLMRQKNKIKEFKKSLESALGEDSRWIMRKRVGQVLADEIAIEPVIDVLQGDDPDLKRGAVKLLQRIGTPNAVGLLRQSLSDQFPEVRFYAHSALTELEDAFTSRIQALNATLEKTPSAAAYRLLGMQYRAYADSGLADEIARGQHLVSCRDALLRSLELEPDHDQTMLLLAQALLDLNQLREAWQMFEKCTRFEETASEAQLGLAQIAYQLRDFAKLAEQARRMALSDAPRPQKPDPLALFEFWAGVGKVHHG